MCMLYMTSQTQRGIVDFQPCGANCAHTSRIQLPMFSPAHYNSNKALFDEFSNVQQHAGWVYCTGFTYLCWRPHMYVFKLSKHRCIAILTKITYVRALV